MRWCFVVISGFLCMTEAAGIDAHLQNVLQEMCPDYTQCANHGNISNTTRHSTEFVSGPSNGQPTCCFPCSCEIRVCRIRDNCCPSVQITEATTTAANTGTIMEPNSNSTTKPVHDDEEEQEGRDHSNLLLETVCQPTSVNINRRHLEVNETKYWSARHLHLGVYMVSGCPVGVNDTRCTEPDVATMAEMTPQTDSNGITYRNVYCAACNNVTYTSRWKVYVTCSNINIYKADDLLFPNTVEKMYKYAVTSELPTCGVDFLPPDNVTMTTSLCLSKNENVISECNITQANQSMVDACRSVRMPYVHSTPDGITVYANVFCFMCNFQSVGEPVCPMSVGLSFYHNNTFVAELNVDGVNETSFLTSWLVNDLTPEQYVPGHVDCTNNTVFDPYTRECREWYCPSGRMVSHNGCVPILNVVEKATYRVDLKLDPDKLSLDNYNATNKTDIAHAVLDSMFGSAEGIKTEMILLAEEVSAPHLYVFFLINIVSKMAFIKNIFDETIYENDVIVDGVNGAMTVSISFYKPVKLELSSFLFTDVIVIDMRRYSALRNLYRTNMPDLEQALLYPRINRLSFCTHILLNRNEIRYYVDILDIRKSDVRLFEGEFLRTVKYENVRVCMADYLRNVHYDMKPKPTLAHSPQAILSVICNLMSMVGLLLTLFTYVVFEELRSVPGKNNMMLSLHLLIAQGLYQFGMDKTEYENACVVLGMLIHLFWLTAIFWMNACTLHMFRTFVTGQSYRSVRALDPQVCGYAIYCYGVAILMVGINVGVSLYETDFKDIGYGDRVCYISNPVMVGWTFALPVGIIIILNMSFFFAVVYQISASTMRRRGKQTDRANTVIYMKLSSLTGVTWIFGYLYLWTDFVPLEYIFIVLNAGQGVFICISFICTKRIMKLYRGFFRKWIRSVRDTGACACARKTDVVSETNAVEMNTAKISITAASSSKGFLPSAIARKIMRFNSSSGLRSSKKGDKGTNQKVVGKLSDNSESDVFKDSAVIAHALTKQQYDHNRKLSRKTESESLSSDPEAGLESDNRSITAVVCHTQVNMMPNGQQGSIDDLR